METVSVHGGLVHVEFHVNSVSSDGITSLVNNSPELITCHISVLHFVQLQYSSAFADYFKERFCCRKLFKIGKFHISYTSDRSEVIISGGNLNCKIRGNFSPLWHYDNMIDLLSD